MSEAEYLAFLRKTAEDVDKMLSGIVKPPAGGTVRVDPQKVRALFRDSVAKFRGWWDEHHRTADATEKPNPIDWPTPQGRKAFAGDKQLACWCTTLWAIHDSNKNPCSDIQAGSGLRATMYDIILRQALPVGKDEGPPVYDWTVITEAVRRVSEHLAGEAAALRQPSETTSSTAAGHSQGERLDDGHQFCGVGLTLEEIGVALGMSNKARSRTVLALLREAGIIVHPLSRKQHLVAVDTIPKGYRARFAQFLKDHHGVSEYLDIDGEAWRSPDSTD